MTGRPVIVLGTGGHAAAVIGLARRAGRAVRGCVGPERPMFPESLAPYLGNDDVLRALQRDSVELAMGVGSIGDVSCRRELFETAKAAGFQFATLCDPAAHIVQDVEIMEGAQVMAGAVIQILASIGPNAIINTGAIVEHHCKIGAHVHVAPGAVVCGAATIEQGTHVGANATVLQGVWVAAGSVIGAGAVVVRDVSVRARVKGNPAA